MSTSAVEGQATVLRATVQADSGAVTPLGSVTFSDTTTGTALGTVVLQRGIASLTTSFAEEGTHDVTAAYRGSAGFLPSSATKAIAVADAPLSGLARPAPLRGAEGVPFFAEAVPVSGVVARFSDEDPAGIASDYRATVAWGDGSTSTGTVAASSTGFTVTASHTYQEDGNYPITVHISDAGGSTTTVNSSAHVSEPKNLLALLVDLFFERFGF